MNKLTGFFIAAAVWMSMSFPPASAEERKEQEAKKEKLVTLEETVVTATNYETTMKEVPATVTVITRDEIAAQNFPDDDIGDALRSIPGITLRRAYSPFPAYINIRGATEQGTVVLVNNVPTNWEITQAIPVDNVERVEVLRGPASALYGANAVGGVVNIITKEGGEGFSANAGIRYGSFNTRQASAGVNGTTGPVHYSVVGYDENSQGANVARNHVNPSITMIQDTPYDKSAASSNTTLDLPHMGKLSLFYNYFHDNYTRGRPNVGGDWDRNFATLIWDQPFSNELLFKGYVGYRYDDLLHLYDGGGSNYALRQTRDTDYTEVPLELQLTGRLGWGNTLTGGFFSNYQDTHYDYNDPEGANVGTNRYKVRTFAGYLQDVWSPLDNLAITAGLRFDHWENYDNEFYNFKDTHPGDRTDESWSPKIGAKYTFGEATSVWANYARGFVPPSPEQLYDDRTSGGNPRIPNPDLEPETTDSWELGVERLFGKRIKARAVGFYAETQDKIISWFGADNVWMNKNIGRTRSYGIELESVLRLSEHWTLNANYTWNPVKIVENDVDTSQEGNSVPFCPVHKANFGVTYSKPDNFRVSLFGRYLSKQQTNEDNVEYTSAGEEQFMKPSFVVDFKATKYFLVDWSYIHRIEVSFSMDNVFNEDYRTFYIYEDPGRVVFGEIRFAF